MIDIEKQFDSFIDSISKDKSFDSEIKQIKSKSLLKEVGGGYRDIQWKYIVSRVIRNFTAIMFGIERISIIKPEKLGQYELLLHEVAQTWESVAKLEEGIDRDNAYLNAVISYELSGYQANALCIANKLANTHETIDAYDLVYLIDTFLKRNYVKLAILTNFSIENVNLNLEEKDLSEIVAFSLASEAFSSMCEYFLNGDIKKILNALDFLEKSIQLYSQNGYVNESNQLRGIKHIIPILIENSTWNILQNLNDNSRWKRYLKLLARGNGESIISSSSISELWISQISAIKKGLLSDSSVVVKMPTSAGKTRIAEIAIAHTMINNPESKCIYIAPYKALVTELESSFLNIFSDLGFRISSIKGNNELNTFEDIIINDADILVLTPEKLDLLQRVQPEFLENVKLIILDEGHIVDEDDRGIKFELLLTRLKRKLPQTRFILLSAVIPKETLEDFSNWLRHGEETIQIESSWRPALQKIALFQWVRDKGDLTFLEKKDDPTPQFARGLISEKHYTYINPESGRRNTDHFPLSSNRSHTCVELAVKFVDLGPVLIFCPTKGFVKTVAKAFEKRLKYYKYATEAIPISLTEDNSRISYQVAKEWLTEEHIVTSLLKHGVAIHTGDIPDPVRKAIERDISLKKIGVIIATSTLAQGVNLPIRTIIIHSCYRRKNNDDEEIYEREKIPAREYWNIAGRAGRAGKETEGLIIHLNFNDDDVDDFNYYLERRNNIEPVYSVLFKLLLNLMNERISDEFYNKLDPEILALLVEEKIDNLTDDKLSELFDGTLVQVQTNRYNLPIEPIKEAFKTTASRILINTTSNDLWSTYSSTGLSSKSCEIIKQYIYENLDKINLFMTNINDDNFKDIIKMLIDISIKIPELKSRRDFSGSIEDLLFDWIQGMPMEKILSKYQEDIDKNEELVKFIENYFGYLLPWGVSGVIKIANKLCELESKNISLKTLFLPSMIKFGVPNPESSWGMSIGIPTRNLAIRIGASYIVETLKYDYNDYLEWIGDKDEEFLKEKYEVKSPLLEDMGKIITQTGFNPYLKKHSSITELLPFETKVKGIAYGLHRNVAYNAKIGMDVVLERDYNNLIDRNTILVKIDGGEIGYLDWKIAQLAAVDVDCGLKLRGKIISMKTGTVPEIVIQLFS